MLAVISGCFCQGFVEPIDGPEEGDGRILCHNIRRVYSARNIDTLWTPACFSQDTAYSMHFFVRARGAQCIRSGRSALPVSSAGAPALRDWSTDLKATAQSAYTSTESQSSGSHDLVREVRAWGDALSVCDTLIIRCAVCCTLV